MLDCWLTAHREGDKLQVCLPRIFDDQRDHGRCVTVIGISARGDDWIQYDVVYDGPEDCEPEFAVIDHELLA